MFGHGGYLWYLIKMLKGLDELPSGNDVLPHSCRLGASSLPLEPRLSVLPFGGTYGILTDRIICEGLVKGPLV